MSPTVAPVATITYAGEPRTLKFGLLAYKDLGLNPFDPVSIAAFKEQDVTLELSAKLIRAGLLHEYHGSNAPRRGQVPPTADDVLADLGETGEFTGAWEKLMSVFGSKKQDGDQEAPADPPKA